MTNKPISRKANIVVQEMDSEILIYDLSINKAYCLNQTAGLVFQLCDGKRTVAEISDLMSKELKMLVSEDCVWLALDGLKKDGLLENAEELTNHFAGLTRREVVKKVGLASMVMLPLISSVVAPNAVMAASGLPNLSACVADSQCQSGNCTNITFLCCPPGVTADARAPGSPTNTPTFNEALCVMTLATQCCSQMTVFTAPMSCVCS